MVQKVCNKYCVCNVVAQSMYKIK